MALLRRGDLDVTDVCFAVGCSSVGTFSTLFAERVGVPPSVYRREARAAAKGMLPCVAKQVTSPTLDHTFAQLEATGAQVDQEPWLQATASATARSATRRATWSASER